jgi:hypothetical protein
MAAKALIKRGHVEVIWPHMLGPANERENLVLLFKRRAQPDGPLQQRSTAMRDPTKCDTSGLTSRTLEQRQTGRREAAFPAEARSVDPHQVAIAGEHATGHCLSATQDATSSSLPMFLDQLDREVSMIRRRASKERTIAENMVFASASMVTIGAVAAATALIVSHHETAAGPVYSRQTNLPCEQCHTRSGKLTAFGEKFKANGNKLPEPKP